MAKVRLTIKNLRTREVVSEIGVVDESRADKVTAGALINMNTDEYFVDEEPVKEGA